MLNHTTRAFLINADGLKGFVDALDIIQKIKDADENITGIQVTWESGEPCEGGEGMNSFTMKVMCDAMQTGKGTPTIDGINKDDECNPVVTLSHNAGCPINTGNELT